VSSASSAVEPQRSPVLAAITECTTPVAGSWSEWSTGDPFLAIAAKSNQSQIIHSPEKPMEQSAVETAFGSNEVAPQANVVAVSCASEATSGWATFDSADAGDGWFSVGAASNGSNEMGWSVEVAKKKKSVLNSDTDEGQCNMREPKPSDSKEPQDFVFDETGFGNVQSSSLGFGSSAFCGLGADLDFGFGEHSGEESKSFGFGISTTDSSSGAGFGDAVIFRSGAEFSGNFGSASNADNESPDYVDMSHVSGPDGIVKTDEARIGNEHTETLFLPAVKDATIEEESMEWVLGRKSENACLDSISPDKCNRKAERRFPRPNNAKSTGKDELQGLNEAVYTSTAQMTQGNDKESTLALALAKVYSDEATALSQGDKKSTNHDGLVSGDIGTDSSTEISLGGMDRLFHSKVGSEQSDPAHSGLSINTRLGDLSQDFIASNVDDPVRPASKEFPSDVSTAAHSQVLHQSDGGATLVNTHRVEFDSDNAIHSRDSSDNVFGPSARDLAGVQEGVKSPAIFETVAFSDEKPAAVVNERSDSSPEFPGQVRSVEKDTAASGESAVHEPSVLESASSSGELSSTPSCSSSPTCSPCATPSRMVIRSTEPASSSGEHVLGPVLGLGPIFSSPKPTRSPQPTPSPPPKDAPRTIPSRPFFSPGSAARRSCGPAPSADQNSIGVGAGVKARDLESDDPLARCIISGVAGTRSRSADSVTTPFVTASFTPSPVLDPASALVPVLRVPSADARWRSQQVEKGSDFKLARTRRDESPSSSEHGSLSGASSRSLGDLDPGACSDGRDSEGGKQATSSLSPRTCDMDAITALAREAQGGGRRYDEDRKSGHISDSEGEADCAADDSGGLVAFEPKACEEAPTRSRCRSIRSRGQLQT
jgi:hypothetical protein